MVRETAHHATVLGAGSWGTALAIHLGRVGHHATLWGRDAALARDMRERRANPTYLPDVTFPDTMQVSSAIDEALAGAHYVVVAVPSHGLRAVMRAAAPHLPPHAILVSATKGIEAVTLQRMSEVMRDESGGAHPVVVLSGPSFASEVARNLPTALVAASDDRQALDAVQAEFRGPVFRLYDSDDVIGVEVGASLKNVIAIGAGVVESLDLGHNAMSALITRGLAEISRLTCAMGGKRDTLSGLSGLGDLVLTCTGALSRNRHVGIELGRGRSLADIVSGMKMVAEGIRTTTAALALGQRHQIELPIIATMSDVLDGRIQPREAVGQLMGRRQRAGSDLMSLFGRIKAGLAKTAQQIRERLTERSSESPTPGGGASSAESIDAIEDVLIGADVGLAAAERIVAAVRAGTEGSLSSRVAAEVKRILKSPPIAADDGSKPRVILIVGVNGTGKTTSVGKLANVFRSEGRSVLICAADTFRAAAVEQLAVWAERAGVDLVRAQSGADPAAVAFDAVVAAKSRGRDIVIVDTAGRLHTRANLMAELDKIRRVVGKEVPGAPHEVLLVLDATVGQNGLVQAREFMNSGGVNGIVLTKLDGTAKGGIAVAIANDLKLPIRYVGVGEGIDDLVPFDADAYVSALFTDTW